MKAAIAALLVAGFLLYGCTAGPTAPSTSPGAMSASLTFNLSESGGKTGTYFTSWTLSNGTLTVVENGQTVSATLSSAQLQSLVQYVSDSGFFSKSLAQTGSCADCYAYGGFVQLDGQRRDVQVSGNDVPSDVLDGLVQRLAAFRPSAQATAECRTDADCVVSGCSGQLCQAKSKPQAATTCEYRDEYACYKLEGCLCQAGKCAWSADSVQCVKDAFDSATQPAGQKEAEFNCVQSCREARFRGVDLSAGPCLSEFIAADWVCDVAHAPRQDVDDQKENTCAAFGVSAKHFVEVDADCQIIQTS